MGVAERQFQDQIDVNLTGVWKTIKATVPMLLSRTMAASIILIGSISGLTVELNVGSLRGIQTRRERANADALR